MNNTTISLDLLKIGDSANVVKINSIDDIKRRLLDMGITENSVIKCILESPFKDPRAYLVKGATIAIRNCDAKDITVRCCNNE